MSELKSLLQKIYKIGKIKLENMFTLTTGNDFSGNFFYSLKKYIFYMYLKINSRVILKV